MTSNNIMKYCVLETKEGYIPFTIANKKLWDLYLPYADREDALKAIQAESGSIKVLDKSGLENLDELLTGYFNGTRVDFSNIPVDMSRYTEFTQKVLTKLNDIPFGSIVSYADMAVMCDNPKAARAVGNALGRNHTPLILPCHRVVAANKKIGGFGAGIHWKYRLLEIEGIKL